MSNEVTTTQEDDDKYSDYMVDSGAEAQILCKVINTGSMAVLKVNCIDETYFAKYKAMYNFISEHDKKYGNVPDISTMAIKFPDFELFEVSESDKYLIENLSEQNLYRKACIVIKDIEPLLIKDSNQAVEFLMSQVPLLTQSTRLESVDIVADADVRLHEYEYLTENHEEVFTQTGFMELDEICGGWKRVELAFILGRPNNGKSWLLHRAALHARKQGKRVGIYSGEMEVSDVGYRIDTLESGISNTCLIRGNKAIKDKYTEYIDQLKKVETPIVIATQKEFNGRPGPAKIDAFIQKYNLDIVFIDQLSLMKDDKKSRDRRLTYENICQDLLDLTMRHQVPIVCAVQANRKTNEQEDDDKLPRLENIAESDSIGQIATKVIAMCQHEGRLWQKVVKNRNLALGPKLVYDWIIDKGVFTFNAEGTAEAQASEKGGMPPPKARRTKRDGKEMEAF